MDEEPRIYDAVALARLMSEHLEKCCPSCRRDLHRLLATRPELADLVARAGAPAAEGAAPTTRFRSAFGPAARRAETRAREVREDRSKARRDLRALLRVPVAERADKIVSARSRYRSRAFAELVLEEARCQVKEKPAEARELASLVPVVLHWLPGAEAEPWRLALELRSRAHVANALRVSGDLVAADRCFAALHRDLEPSSSGTVEFPDALAESASLEASLRTDQRRLAEAEALLERAAGLYRRTGFREGLARVLIQRANLARHREEFGVAEDHLRQAVELLDPAEQASLYTDTVEARALCLVDLERWDEAEAVLAAHRQHLAVDEASWSGYLLRGILGRIALGRGEHAVAEEAFLAVREGALGLGRDYDAALASLDLAQVYLEEDRADELRDLASGLVPAFRARGVSREALVALGMLHRAVRSRRISRSGMQRIRRRLRHAALHRS